MGRKYEKMLDEYYDIEIEDIEEDELDLEPLMGTEFKHIENHFAAEKKAKELAEDILTEYDKALKVFAKDQIIQIFHTKDPDKKFYFDSDDSVWKFIKDNQDVEYIRQLRDPAEPERMIIDYGDHRYFYIYKALASKLD